jgi:hypothetical protein
MWKMPRMLVKPGKKKYVFVVAIFGDTNTITLIEGQTYVVKPGPWPHVGRKGVFIAPWNDNEVMLDENQEQEDREFLFCPDPRSLELVNLH